MPSYDAGVAPLSTCQNDGFTFDVADAGPEDGELVVLLHGFPENKESWAAITPHLVDAGYRVLAPDQRGYSPGARPKARRAYALPRLTGDVLALVAAAGRGDERFHVVGQAFGTVREIAVPGIRCPGADGARRRPRPDLGAGHTVSRCRRHPSTSAA